MLRADAKRSRRGSFCLSDYRAQRKANEPGAIFFGTGIKKPLLVM
jgi:hypothetical protein